MRFNPNYLLESTIVYSIGPFVLSVVFLLSIVVLPSVFIAMARYTCKNLNIIYFIHKTKIWLNTNDRLRLNGKDGMF